MFRISNIALEMLLKFLYSILSYLANHQVKGTDHNNMKYIADNFPNSLAKGRALINLNRDNFQQYVCCAKCLAVYKFSDCYERRGSQAVSMHCTSCEFPLHSRKSLRSTCNYPLLKRVKLARKVVLKPTKIYCYKPITDSLNEIISRPGIAELCEEWRERDKVDDIYADVYDGRVWREFEGKGFFLLPRSYGLMLNIDWFQPFEHSIYSIGVIYVALLNLPRNIRYNEENVIICGLVPGPKEPKNDINSFLEPLVEELLKLWKGIEVSLNDESVTLKAALFCVSCDSPAMRKTTGFVAHNARKGCFKCLKSFPTSQFGEKPDYSGFDRSKWKYRTNSTFKKAALKYKHSKTVEERNRICKHYGVRYTVLITLPYYDAIRFTIVDPMHNLLLGSAKTFIGLLKSDKILQTSEYEKIQCVIDNFVIPTGTGRLPHKVEHGFANLKADEWKNWILIFSLVALKPLVDSSIYSLWTLFVQACSLLCSRVITFDAIERADKLIHKYCCSFEDTFGKDKCYPNLHLHCHLKDCFLDHGPATSFWLFGFERMNGMLGNVHTNKQAVEIQLFRKFISKQQVCTVEWPKMELSDAIRPLLCNATRSRNDTHGSGLFCHILNSYTDKSIFSANIASCILPPVKEKSLFHEDVALINSFLAACFPSRFSKVLVIHKWSNSMIFNGDLYSSYFSRQRRNSLAFVRLPNLVMNPCFILSFIECTVVMEEKSTIQCKLVKILPLLQHQEKSKFPYPVEVWTKPDLQHFDSTDYCFVFPSCLLCRCAFSTTSIDDSDSSIVVIPCNSFAGLYNMENYIDPDN